MGYSTGRDLSVQFPGSKGESVKSHLELRHDRIVLWSEFELSWFVTFDLSNAEQLYNDLRILLLTAGHDV